MSEPIRQPGRRAVTAWLWVCVAMLFAMIVLGGVVRLTGSGLSITVWEPIVGTIPPLNHAAWERAFGLYRDSPEFRLVNRDMSLESFQSIFWFEYFHRLLGRSIGLLLVVPCAYFLYRRLIDRKLVRGLIVLLFLGGLQGLVGWIMVASGLADAPRVSHYKLTLHLGLGLLIFGYAVWLALNETFGRAARGEWTSLRRATLALTVLISVTILSGGLMAGLKAGYAFPTFPLMAGQLVPDGLFAVDPLWRNFVDNVVMVQFQHRLLALSVLGGVIALFVVARRVSRLLLGAATLQVVLGISTLVFHVPIALAAAHQANAALLLGAALYANYALVRWPIRQPAPVPSVPDALGETS
jgi:cytochrome c oxidase assembly protein subunit 15